MNNNSHLNIQPSFNTKPREALAIIKFSIEEPQENASVLGVSGSRWKEAASDHISTSTTDLNSTSATGPENRRIEELEEDANLYGGIAMVLRGVAGAYGLCSGSYTNLEEIYKSVSPTEGFMEVAASGAQSIPDEPFGLSNLIGPIGGTILGAISVPTNPIASISVAGGIFLCLSIIMRIQRDRAYHEEKD